MYNRKFKIKFENMDDMKSEGRRAKQKSYNL